MYRIEQESPKNEITENNTDGSSFKVIGYLNTSRGVALRVLGGVSCLSRFGDIY